MKKKILLALPLVAIPLVWVLLFPVHRDNGTQKRDYPEIKSSGILNIVTEYNLIDYYVSGDSVAGLQYSLCKYLEQCSGLKVKIHLENNLNTCISRLENNDFDVIARHIPVTTESKNRFVFTVPIARSKQVLVQRKASGNDSTAYIHTQIDLANKTLHVPKNSPVIFRLENLSEEIAEPIHIEEISDYTAEQLIYMVSDGYIDYAVVDNEIARKNLPLFPNIDIRIDISFTQFQAWAVRESAPALLDSLNRWLPGYRP
ncbi:MAG: transporter substrate-binding domain-containing protein [Dysgonamonadaceae bacterium]|jgi:membrane-bound lytic murein transglycosylase MltF|nr:transporter substrate-binding domain-containing protein [Dysgonamonadaceae bacterium]